MFSMPPKVDTSDPEVARLLTQFESISFTGQKANETLRNAKTANNLSALIERCDLASKQLDAKQGSLVASVAASAPNDLSLEKRAYVVERVVDGSLPSNDRVTIACKFVAGQDKINKEQFDEACGVGESSWAFTIVGENICMMSKFLKLACIRAVAASEASGHNLFF